MGMGKWFMILSAAVLALIFCAAGVLFRKKDLFSALNHPLAKKHPNISKRFGTIMICFALIWFFLVLALISS